MNSKKTNQAKSKATKTQDKAKKHKKLTPEKLKVIKGGQERPVCRVTES